MVGEKVCFFLIQKVRRTGVRPDVDCTTVGRFTSAVAVLEEEDLLLLHDAGSAVDPVAKGFLGQVLAHSVLKALKKKKLFGV